MFLKKVISTLVIVSVCILNVNCTQEKKNKLVLASLAYLFVQSQARSSNCNYKDFTTDGAADPFYSSQWYYSNSGEDLNPSSVWNTNRGDNIRVAVVDDGMDIYHEDLSTNVLPGGSYNFGAGYYGFSTSLSDPYSTDATHGTAVSGVIGARDKNGLGIAGIASRSCLVGYNVLENATDANINTAMTYNASDVSASNNSWGATDGNGKTASGGSLWSSGVDLGLSTGRGGKGTVYFWAAGNGANTNNATGASGSSSAYPVGSLETDNSNYDGQANYYGVAAICALTDDGKRVYYSEKGANLLVCGYAQKTTYSTTQDGIWTTDITGYYGYNPLPTSYIINGYSQGKQLSNNNYSKIFNGTSGATPMATATAALILNANSNLSWRDVKLIFAESARKNDPTDSDWTTNAGTKISSSGTAYNINHKYGFGVIDINRAVTIAKTWTNVGAMVMYDTGTITANTAFANNTTLAAGATSTKAITTANTSITKIEFIEVTVSTSSADASDLEIALTSPQGTSSTLAEAHICSSSTYTYPSSTTMVDSCGNYSGWVFGTVRHLGETAIGTWTLRVADRRSGTGSSSGWGNGGTLTSWRLKFYGRAN